MIAPLAICGKLRIIKVGISLLSLFCFGIRRLGMENIIVDNAKVMAKGQITLPKDIRALLGVTTGDRVTLVCDGNRVYLMNSAIYAMQMLQKNMAGEAEKANLSREEEIDALLKDVRSEFEGI